MKTAIVFFTNKPHEATLQFASQVRKQTKFDVYVIEDNNEDLKYTIEVTGALKVAKPPVLVRIDDKECIAQGYNGSNISETATHIQKTPIAFDKFLYFFCQINTDYDFVWFFEDDVFIPSVETITRLHKNYSTMDLVCANNFPKPDETTGWHWRYIMDKIEPPYYTSMMCAGGVSRALLNKIYEYVQKHKRLFYLEAMMNTIAMQNNLKIHCPLEMKSIVWMGKWDLDEFCLLPNNVFHPKKEIDKHEEYRQEIDEAKKYGFIPTNTLPDFIKELM